MVEQNKLRAFIVISYAAMCKLCFIALERGEHLKIIKIYLKISMPDKVYY